MRSPRRLFEGRLLLTSVLAAMMAVTFISTADASSKRDAKDAAGTVGVTDRAILMSYRGDEDIVQERLVHRILTGTFAGSEVSVAKYTIHPDGSATITAVSSCTCTVEGRTGTVTFKDRGTASAAGVIVVHRTSIDATGELAGLQAKLEITGLVTAPTQTYVGRYQFGD
jgi:Protein of unknown function (DUF3224)